MTLSGQRDGYRCFVTVPAAERNRLVRSHQLAAATLALPEAARQAHVAALLYVTARNIGAPNSRWRGWIEAKVRTGALMTVSRSMLPFESSHELAVADALVAAGRAFEKPLRFDAERDLVFPDFILQDTVRSAGYPMEVFDRMDEAYAARRAGKENYYNMTFGVGGWWSWDATTGSRMPPFPSGRLR
ncbi:DUF1173 family protein [Novacetimonas hansenii]|uniref:DUF1173 domain-containing protein n=1 Tax=Novacetimonas hansenii TaxID=436 RepID=A0AAW5ENQ2_NOVHA|nr:DUF1173 family protein [Novacetimonas hansenii]MCJ8352920.1 DUF1173 domain-containing protein [Novacetimonas hansenii]